MLPQLTCMFNKGGEACDCAGFEFRADQDPNEPRRCRDCTHYQNWHQKKDDSPAHNVVKSIMKKCDAELDAIYRPKSKPKATSAEAAQEAIHGLKKESQIHKNGVKNVSTDFVGISGPSKD